MVAGRSRALELNLQPERAVLYNAFARRYGVPVLGVYQAGGTWGRSSEPNPEVEPYGVLIEYLGYARGRHRHHLTFFEPGLSLDRERVYDPDLPTGGRVDVRPGGVLEYIITSDEPLLFEWPASLSVAENDLERGLTWLGGTNRYSNTRFFGSLALGLDENGEVSLASFVITGSGEDPPAYEGNLCFDLNQSFDPREDALLCSAQ